jgi:hypothetical protein
MNTKLTLKLDKDVIEKAKEYASTQKRSLSKIIETFLQTLANQDNVKYDDEIQISQFVKSMTSGVNIPPDFDYKKEYTNHLIEKYK